MSDEESDIERAARLGLAVARVVGFELRHHDGNYQIVFISSLTGDALPFEDNLTLDDVQRWVDENAVDDGH